MTNVSILARALARAQQIKSVIPTVQLEFQSSPALSRGRNHRTHGGGGQGRVSILARALARAQRLISIEALTRGFVSILARALARAQRTHRVRSLRARRFQSSPALSRGRNLGCGGFAWWLRTFQSSPALSRGRNS